MMTNSVGLARARLQARWMLSLKAVRIELLDQQGAPVKALDDSGQIAGVEVASGFLMRQPAGLYLYTCWHVVTYAESSPFFSSA
jgi:hypothetical protein